MVAVLHVQRDQILPLFTHAVTPHSSKGDMTYDPKQTESSYLATVLDKIIDSHLDEFRTSGTFKVRPGYSYDTFYLDKVQGSFDESLNGLIHHIMFKDGVYKAFLTDEQFDSCKAVVEQEPESIWGPSDDDDDCDSLQDTLDEIYLSTIMHVRDRLKAEGFTVEALDDYCDQF